MEPGEQTRDEQHGLISALYHALRGAGACDAYALDAEAAGRADLAGYFVEARTAYVRIAEEAKGMLGILEATPEPVVPPEGMVPGVGLDEALLGEEASSSVPQVVAARIPPEDIDQTAFALRDGVENLTLESALEEIDGWEYKLEESNDPQLAPIAESLRQLRTLLTVDGLDPAAIGELLTVLGRQVQDVASGDLGSSVAEKLRRLGGLLDTEGRSISGGER